MFTWLLLLLPCVFVSADGPTDGHGTTQSISVTGAGTDAVNGIYFLAAANPAHSWVETGLDYYVLREATDGNQACLIDLYYNKDTSAWKISVNGHEQYSSSGIFATWSVANNGQEPPPQVSRSPVYVTGAGTAAVNGEYQPSVPNAAHTWVDPAKEYYMLKAATDGNQAGLIDLYYNKDTSGWKISSNGHEQYSSQEIFGSWSALQGEEPPPSVSGPSRTSVSCGSTTSNLSSATSSTTSSSLSTVFLAFVPLTAAAAWVEVC